MALAGTASTKFLGIFEGAFGEEENEEEAPKILPIEEEEEEILPEEAVTTKDKADTEFGEPSTSSTGKCKTCSATKQPPVKKYRKQAAPTKSTGPFALKYATPVFPEKSNKAGYLHTGVPDAYILH